MTPVSGQGSSSRKLHSWIDSFVDYCNALYAPHIFRKWGAISIISSALERKVWVRTRGRHLYPNLYIFLVGGPGSGKGLVVDEISRFLTTISDPANPAGTLNVAPLSVTTSSLVDAMNDAKRKIVRPTETPPYLEFHSLQVVVPEFSDFAPMYEARFMSALQSLYDCSDTSPFGEKRRGKDINIKIQSPQLSIIAGTTPSYLNSFMPEGAWDQGFISRTIMIFSGEMIVPDLFAEDHKRDSLFLELKADLKSIFNIFGKMEWTPEAAGAIQAWINAGQEPVPEHRKLLHYNSRRIGQVIKLCMVASVSRGADLLITIEDYQMALGWLLEAEYHMGDIFKSVSVGGDASAIDDCFGFIFQEWMRNKTPIGEHRLVEFLRQRVPSHAVMRIIDVMIRSRMIESVDSAGPGGTFRYKPIGKQMHTG